MSFPVREIQEQCRDTSEPGHKAVWEDFGRISPRVYLEACRQIFRPISSCSRDLLLENRTFLVCCHCYFQNDDSCSSRISCHCPYSLCSTANVSIGHSLLKARCWEKDLMFRSVSDSKKLENLLALSTWSCLARLSTASVFCLSLDTNNNESYHHNLVTSITHVTKTSLSTWGLQP